VLPFWASDLVLLAVQAALVLVPSPPIPGLDRLRRSRAWAWVLPASLGLTVALLAVLPGAAPIYTYLALVGCPIGAALVFSGGRRRRAGLALLAPALLAIAWARQDALSGQAAALALTALSAIPLAAILNRIAPALAIKAGIVAMAVLDAILVFSNGLQQPNDVLNAAAPAAHLPRLQLADFGAAIMGYGDLFIAAVLGAVLATRARRRRAAVLTLGLAVAFDALFFVVDVLPATVPVALALLVDEAWERRGSVVAALRVPRAETP
jgi:hypothetical protein